MSAGEQAQVSAAELEEELGQPVLLAHHLGVEGELVQLQTAEAS